MVKGAQSITEGARKSRSAFVLLSLSITLSACATDRPALLPASTSPSKAGLSDLSERPRHSNSASDLLYVANVKTVSVYSYPGNKLEETLPGFGKAHGECVDSNGSVYVTDFVKSEIVEFAHGQKKRVATFKSPLGAPLGCSIDNASGALAVSALDGLAVFPKNRKNPSVYKDSTFRQFQLCGYDNGGNLFVDGFSSSFDFKLDELPKGGTALKELGIDKSIGWPGQIQWDGTFLTVGDAELLLIYRVRIRGAQAVVVGKTTLQPAGTSANEIYQYFIDQNKVVAPDFYSEGSTERNAVFFYKYPAGGTPSGATIRKGLDYPVGAVVSKAP